MSTHELPPFFRISRLELMETRAKRVWQNSDSVELRGFAHSYEAKLFEWGWINGIYQRTGEPDPVYLLRLQREFAEKNPG